MFKFSLGSFGAFSIFDNLVSQKRLVVERNGPKFGPHGYAFSVYTVLLAVKGHLVHLRFLTTLYLLLS